MAVSGGMGGPGHENGTPGPALWWAEQGTGEPLVLLHGGLTDARFFSAKVPALAERRRTLLMAGDEDAVSLDDTLVLYNGIPDTELAIVPGTTHFLLREKPA